MTRFLLLYIFLLLFIVLIQSKIYDDIDLKGYENPDRFWPFSRTTEENEIIRNTIPFVYGKANFEIEGKGNGHLKFPITKASAELMKFSDLKCFALKCSLTVAFWSRISGVDVQDLLKEKKEKKVSILSSSVFDISYTFKGGNSYLTVQSKLSMTQSQISIGHWYHVLIMIDQSLKLSVHLNGKNLADMIIFTNAPLPTKDLIKLGEFSPGKEISDVFANSYFYIGSLGIWKRLLSIEEQKKVYLAELGPFINDTSCRVFKEMYIIEWTIPADPYQQIKNVTLKTWPASETPTWKDDKSYKILIPKWNSMQAAELSFLPEHFDLSVKHHIKVEAYISKHHRYITQGLCEISSPLKENTISIYSPSPFSIKISWKKRYNTKASFYVHVMCSGNYIDKASKHETTSKTISSSESLETLIKLLKPSSDCRVTIERTFMKSRIQHSYMVYIKTKPLISLVRYSVSSVEIMERTWNSAKIKFNFHPEFYNYELEYTFYYISDDLTTSSTSLQRTIPKHTSDFIMNIQMLPEDSYFRIDCQVKDIGMLIDGPRMQYPVVFSTRVRYPPPEKAILIEKKPTSLKFSLHLEKDLKISKHNIKFLLISARVFGFGNMTSYKKVSVDSTEVVMDNLKISTLYEIRAATGDGEEFGKMKLLLTVETESVTTTSSTTTVVSKSNIKSGCDNEYKQGIYWKASLPNALTIMPCPKGYTGNATRKCIEKKSGEIDWAKPNTRDCKSQKLLALKSAPKLPARKLTKVLGSFVSETKEIYSKDLLEVISLMEVIKTDDTNVTTSQSLDVLEGVANITSNLLDEKAIASWDTLPSGVRSKIASSLMDVTDSIIEKSFVEDNETKIISTDKLKIKLTSITPSDGKTTFEDITLPNELIESGSRRTLVVGNYFGISDLLGVQTTSEFGDSDVSSTISSDVKSISIVPSLNDNNFEQPLLFNIPLSKGYMNGSQPNCVFWKKSASGGGAWSKEGCKVAKWNTSMVTCSCNHLTNFAILMSLSEEAGDEVGDHGLILKMITCLGLSISLVALLASFLTFALIKKIRSLRNIIHQHLCVALFLGELIFLFGVEQTQHKVACQVIAGVLHYFFLVAFLMMGLEGLVLYLMLVRVYKSRNSSEYGSFKYLVVCWAIPLIVILINICIDRNAYGANRSHCWLSLQNHFVWSFIGPVLAIVMFNFVILIMTFRIMAAKGKNRNSFVQDIWFWSKGCGLLLSVLGISWVLGLFYIDRNTVGFAYAFNIINSFQGLGIFVFHCLCDPRIVKEYHNFICCVRRREARLYRAPSRSSSTGSRKSFFRNSTRMMLRLKSISERESSMDKDLSSNRHDMSSSTNENSVGLLVGRGKS